MNIKNISVFGLSFLLILNMMFCTNSFANDESSDPAQSAYEEQQDIQDDSESITESAIDTGTAVDVTEPSITKPKKKPRASDQDTIDLSDENPPASSNYSYNATTKLYTVLVGKSVRIIGSNETTGARVMTEPNGNVGDQGEITVTFESIFAAAVAGENNAPFIASENTTVIIDVVGNNTLYAGSRTSGIFIKEYADVTLQGTENSSLYLRADNNDAGALIGGGYDISSENCKLLITGASIAGISSSNYAAGIGGGFTTRFFFNSHFGEIQIVNSNISVSTLGKCIGAGSGPNIFNYDTAVKSIEITNSIISEANSIGGYYPQLMVDSITINSGMIVMNGIIEERTIVSNNTIILGGSINATTIYNANNGPDNGYESVYKNAIVFNKNKNKAVESFSIPNASYYNSENLRTDENNQIYLWYPSTHGSEQELSARVDSVNYITTTSITNYDDFNMQIMYKYGPESYNEYIFLDDDTHSNTVGYVGGDPSNAVLWEYDSVTNVYTIKNGASVFVLNSNANTGARVTTEQDGNDLGDTGIIRITLEAVNATGGSNQNDAPLSVGSNSTLYIFADGANYFQGGESPGILIDDESNLVINDCSDSMWEGSIFASSTANGAAIGTGFGQAGMLAGTITINNLFVDAQAVNGAGIGAGTSDAHIEKILINDSTITAISSQEGAGIGGGKDLSSCGDVCITGSSVTAYSTFGSGIGGGSNFSPCSNIEISVSSIKAKTTLGNDVGSGFNNSPTHNIKIHSGMIVLEGTATNEIVADISITIDGGSINAESMSPQPINSLGDNVYKNTLSLYLVFKKKVDIFSIENYPYYDATSCVYTDEHSNVYYWYPETAGPQELEANIGGSLYTGTAETAQNNLNNAVLYRTTTNFSHGDIIDLSDESPYFEGRTNITTGGLLWTYDDTTKIYTVMIGQSVKVIKSNKNTGARVITEENGNDYDPDYDPDTNDGIIFMTIDTVTATGGALNNEAPIFVSENTSVYLTTVGENALTGLRSAGLQIGPNANITIAGITGSSLVAKSETIGAGIGAGVNMPAGKIYIYKSSIAAISTRCNSIGGGISADPDYIYSGSSNIIISESSIDSNRTIGCGAESVGSYVTVFKSIVKTKSIGGGYEDSGHAGEISVINSTVEAVTNDTGIGGSSENYDIVIIGSYINITADTVAIGGNCKDIIICESNILVNVTNNPYTAKACIGSANFRRMNSITISKSAIKSIGGSSIGSSFGGPAGGDVTIYKSTIDAANSRVGGGSDVNIIDSNLTVGGVAPIASPGFKDIKICGSNVNASGKIGGGESSKCGNIVISGSSVTASATTAVGAAIGAGTTAYDSADASAGDIDIIASTIVANAATGAAIGSGISWGDYGKYTAGAIRIQSGMITCLGTKSIKGKSVVISGGSIKADLISPRPTNGSQSNVYKNTILVGTVPNSKIDYVSIEHAPYYDGTTCVYTDEECNVYYWYPESTSYAIGVTSGAVEVSGSGFEVDDDDDNHVPPFIGEIIDLSEPKPLAKTGRVDGLEDGELLWKYNKKTAVYTIVSQASIVRVIGSNENTGARIVTEQDNLTGNIEPRTYIVLNNVSMTGGALDNQAPILIGTNSAVHIFFGGNNVLTGINSAGLQIAERAKLRLNSSIDSSLTACSTENGAGIGAGNNMPGGSVFIDESTITAIAKNGAGIGAGNNASFGNIGIWSSTISASAVNGAGIGCGYVSSASKMASCNNITMSASRIYANSERGSSIGNGYSDSVVPTANAIEIFSGTLTTNGTKKITGSKVIISGGSIKTNTITPRPTNGTNIPVYKNTITIGNRINSPVSNFSIPNATYYDISDVYTDEVANVYFWYPESSEQEILATINQMDFITEGAITEANDLNAFVLTSVIQKSFAETIVLSDPDPILEGRASGNPSGDLLWKYDELTKVYTVEAGVAVRIIESNENTGVRVTTVEQGYLLNEAGIIKMTIEGISATGGALENEAPILVGTESSVILTTIDQNYLTGENSAGLQTAYGSTLTVMGINGSSLTARSLVNGAGIGSGVNIVSNGISFVNASITAIANNGAGIGAGVNSANVRYLDFDNSVIKAESATGSDIGEGATSLVQKIEIHSGMITANNSIKTTGYVYIFGGSIKTNSITPRPTNGNDNGLQDVYKNTIKIDNKSNAKVESFSIPNAAYYNAVSNVWTDDDANVYYWYPASSGQDLVTTLRGIEYDTTAAITNTNDDNVYVLTLSQNNIISGTNTINLNIVFKSSQPNMGSHWSVDKSKRIIYIEHKANVLVIGMATNVMFNIDKNSFVNINLENIEATSQDSNLFEIGQSSIVDIKIVGNVELSAPDMLIFDVNKSSYLSLIGKGFSSLNISNADSIVKGAKSVEIENMLLNVNIDSDKVPFDIDGEFRVENSILNLTNENTAVVRNGINATEIWFVNTSVDILVNGNGIGGDRTTDVYIFGSDVKVDMPSPNVGIGIYAKDRVWIDSANVAISPWAGKTINSRSVVILGGSVNAGTISPRPKNIEGENLYRAICNFPVSNVEITGIKIDGGYNYNYNGTKIDESGRVYIYLPLNVYSTEVIFETEEGNFGGKVITNLGVENTVFNFERVLNYTAKQVGGVRDSKDTTSLLIDFDHPVMNFAINNITLTNQTGKANITGVRMVKDGDDEGLRWEVLLTNVEGGMVNIKLDNVAQNYLTESAKSKTVEVLSRIVVGFKLTQVGGKSKKKNTVSITITFTKPVTGLKTGSVLIKNSTGKATKKSISGKATKYTIKLKSVTKEGDIFVSLKEFGVYKFSNNNLKVKVFKKK